MYHGNLGVGENNFAALYLVNEVFSKIEYPCVIAGSSPSEELKKVVQKYPHIQLIDNWNNEQIMDAVSKAQMNILPTFQGTGIKLKLLNALYAGRFCLVNPIMVKNTTLEDACIISENADAMVLDIQKYWKQNFGEAEITSRKNILNNSLFSNDKNAQIILEILGF